jgi:nucleoid-associated protein YgaU
MRILGCSLVAVVAACGDGREPMPAGDGALVLELGGNQPSLRKALERAGLAVPPPVDLSPAVAVPAPATGDADAPKPTPPVRRGSAEAQKPPTPTPTPTPAPTPAEQAFTTVVLAEGQTLIHLARKHLGDGNRFRDILELNGWTEVESRRLKPGTKVKIPKAGAARGSGR